MWPWRRRKQFLEPHLEDWQIETWRYLLRHLSDANWVAARRPLTPRDAMFARPSDDHGSAIILFERLKEYMQLTDCPAELVQRTERGGKVDAYLFLRESGPLGSFEEHDGRLYISYAPALLRTPSRLGAVLGHELAHYALFTLPEFAQTQGYEGQGWSSQFSGYLSEEGRIFSLALHLALRGENNAPDLKPHLQKMLTRALERIEAEPAILTALKEAGAPA